MSNTHITPFIDGIKRSTPWKELDMIIIAIATLVSAVLGWWHHRQSSTTGAD